MRRMPLLRLGPGGAQGEEEVESSGNKCTRPHDERKLLVVVGLSE